MEKLLAVVGAVVLVVAIIVGVSLLMALPMMWLLNYLLSDTATTAVFGTPEIGFWKAFWLNIFLGLFIKASRCNCSK